MIVTEEPVAETTPDSIVPTIVTDTDAGRGDSLGGYPSDYKSIVYGEDKSYHKVPVPYKSYEFVGTGKKMAYDMTEGNEVEKSLQVYKVQVSFSFLRMLANQCNTNKSRLALGCCRMCCCKQLYHCQTVQCSTGLSYQPLPTSAHVTSDHRMLNQSWCLKCS